MDNVISKAQSKLKRLSEDEETIREYELREKHLSDTITNINGTKREIARKLFEKDIAISAQEVAEIVGLDIVEAKEIERKYR